MEGKKTISVVLMGVSALQIVIIAVRYFQSAANLNNPLIPQSLLEGIRNYSITLIGFYILAIACNGLYLLTKRFFLATAIASGTVMIMVLIFGHYIHDYFLHIN
jgi:small-conductance mechanosensitive channel